MNKAFRYLAAALAALALNVDGVRAQSAPSLINYQGQLLDATGAPMPAGDYVFEVRMFTGESGGTAVWGPQIFNGQSGTGLGPRVVLVDGRFNVILGPEDTQERELSSVVADNPSLFIELKVGTANPISPRQQLLSAPFALKASHASTADNAENAANAVNAQNATNAQNAQNAENAENAENAQNAVNAQNAASANTAQTANTATSATTATTANNAQALQGFNWGTLFNNSNPSNGRLSVEEALVRGNFQLGTGSSDYQTIMLGGGNSFGFLYGDFNNLGDGVHLSYNYRLGSAVAFDGATSRMSVGYGYAAIATGGNGGHPVNRLRVTQNQVIVENASFVNSSDRNVKQNIEPIDPGNVLIKVLDLPISEWSYKADPAARHIGPMAQDFHAAFQLGTDDKHIAPMDEGGVALAAIQGLHQKLEEKDAIIRELQNRMKRLEQMVEENGRQNR